MRRYNRIGSDYYEDIEESDDYDYCGDFDVYEESNEYDDHLIFLYDEFKGQIGMFIPGLSLEKFGERIKEAEDIYEKYKSYYDEFYEKLSPGLKELTCEHFDIMYSTLELNKGEFEKKMEEESKRIIRKLM